MTEHSLETSAAEKLQSTSVADYIVQRIADEGVAHCFGVAGDYLFPMCNALERSPKIKWIGCANELNAAYAADGYARIRGVGMVATTYGVGELSALNGVMGAKAERSLVFHVVGMPSYQNQRLSKIVHHTLGDGNFGNFVGLSAAATCCSAIINPDNCVIEMERVIAEARRNNQPAYILVPSDYAQAPVTPVEVRPVTLKSNEAALKKAIAAISERLKGAKSVVALPAFTIARLGLQKQSARRDRSAGLPVCNDNDGEMSQSTKATHNSLASMRARCQRKARARSSRAPTSCLILAASASTTSPPLRIRRNSTRRDLSPSVSMTSGLARK